MVMEAEEGRSLLNSRGSFIVRLRDGTSSLLTRTLVRGVWEMHTHNAHPFERHTGVVRHVYERVMHGFSIENMSIEMHEYLLQHELVARIMPSMPKKASLDWGLDRLDQPDLPLSNSYTPTLSGEGVNVFVLDSGLDTLHQEFSDSSTRVVKNVYDVWIDDPYHPSSSNDDYGHGTHVAGTIGGKTVGVATAVSIYGVKVLDSKGSGSDSTVLSGIEYVLSWIDDQGPSPPPVLVHMSLGGPCSLADCVNDSISYGIWWSTQNYPTLHFVVAAGNSGCISCQESPASSVNALTVGATQEADHIAGFSNQGKCVDINAPGVGIYSSCPSPQHSCYRTESGTSMAAPHVTGVAAQILQLNPGYSWAELRESVLCAAARNKIVGLKPDTRNLLAQIPMEPCASTAGACSTCNRGFGCVGNCSSRGDCAGGVCVCDTGWYGTNCEANTPGIFCESGYSFPLLLINTDGEGWSGARYMLTTNGTIVSTGTLDCGYADHKDLCLSQGCYNFNAVGSNNPTMLWQLCGRSGTLPSAEFFCVNAQGECEKVWPSCSEGTSSLSVVMHDLYGDGWIDGVMHMYPIPVGYVLSIPSTSPPASSSLTLYYGSREEAHVCLTPGEYAVTVDGGSFPDEVWFELCGVRGTAQPKQESAISISANGTCVGVLIDLSLSGAVSITSISFENAFANEAQVSKVIAQALHGIVASGCNTCNIVVGVRLPSQDTKLLNCSFNFTAETPGVALSSSLEMIALNMTSSLTVAANTGHLTQKIRELAFESGLDYMLDALADNVYLHPGYYVGYSNATYESYTTSESTSPNPSPRPFHTAIPTPAPKFPDPSSDSMIMWAVLGALLGMVTLAALGYLVWYVRRKSKGEGAAYTRTNELDDEEEVEVELYTITGGLEPIGPGRGLGSGLIRWLRTKPVALAESPTSPTVMEGMNALHSADEAGGRAGAEAKADAMASEPLTCSSPMNAMHTGTSLGR